MLPRASVERELGVRIAESELMKNGIELWLSMYKDEPLWKGGEKDVKTLNLPAAISAEFARLILTEFHMESSGSAMATFVDEQMKRALMEKFRHVAIYCALGGIVAKAYPSAPDETGAPTSVAVEWVQADKFYPISFDSNGTVTSAVFVQYKTVGEDIYTRLEIHELSGTKYKVTNKAYVARNPSISGLDRIELDTLLQREIPLTDVEEWLLSFRKLKCRT